MDIGPLSPEEDALLPTRGGTQLFEASPCTNENDPSVGEALMSGDCELVHLSDVVLSCSTTWSGIAAGGGRTLFEGNTSPHERKRRWPAGNVIILASVVGGPSFVAGAFQVTSQVSTTFYPSVSIRNEPRGWSMLLPHVKQISALGNDFGG